VRLVRLLGGADDDVLLGPAATVRAVEAASASGLLARYRYIHFATHGVLGRPGAEGPALLLSRGERLGFDGIARLRLNADLVVLSACQAGGGAVAQTEGVSNLARAFLETGSRGGSARSGGSTTARRPTCWQRPTAGSGTACRPRRPSVGPSSR
jgi:hypothetical protein